MVKKILNIAWKDLILILRDRAALILMLGAPLALTVGLGLVSGSFSGASSSGVGDIPVAIINQDQGQLGNYLIDAFQSEELSDLITAGATGDLAGARRQVEDDLIAAAIIIPPTFSEDLLAEDAQTASPVELYANPGRPISVDVVASIIERYVQAVETGVVQVTVTLDQLLAYQVITPGEIPAAVERLTGQAELGSTAASLIEVGSHAPDQEVAETIEVNPLALIAPAMAMLFLMYTVTLGGRSLLAERAEWTLQRMLSTPTAAWQVLAGKMFGIYLSAVAQVGLLVLGSSLMFGLRWGQPLAVALLILAVAAGATGWGILLAAVARTPGQVTSFGGALMLTFGVLGGGFTIGLPSDGTLSTVGKITPNAWGLQGFTALAKGGGLAEIRDPIIGLSVMTIVLFTVAVIIFRQRGVIQR
jgi:ABC-2 type transport system permease protein